MENSKGQSLGYVIGLLGSSHILSEVIVPLGNMLSLIGLSSCVMQFWPHTGVYKAMGFPYLGYVKKRAIKV